MGTALYSLVLVKDYFSLHKSIVAVSYLPPDMMRIPRKYKSHAKIGTYIYHADLRRLKIFWSLSLEIFLLPTVGFDKNPDCMAQNDAPEFIHKMHKSTD